MSLVTASNFVVFATTLPKNKTIKLENLGRVRREVYKECLIINYAKFLLKITRKGQFTIFASDLQYCFTNLTQIIKKITRALNLASDVGIRKCYFQIKNIQFRANLNFPEDDLVRIAKRLCDTRSSDTYIGNIVFIYGAKEEKGESWEAKEITDKDLSITGILRIKIHLTCENKSKITFTVHRTGRITGVRSRIKTFLFLAEQIESISNHVHQSGSESVQ